MTEAQLKGLARDIEFIASFLRQRGQLPAGTAYQMALEYMREAARDRALTDWNRAKERVRRSQRELHDLTELDSWLH